MLTSLDDYPIHQTPTPVSQPASGDRNHYDRYFFNGYATDASAMFAVAMGRYPNRSVVDAAFSVLRDGAEVSVLASGRAPADPAVTEVGPIAVDVVEPLRRLRVRVDAPQHGLEAELTFVARTAALEEPRYQRAEGTRTVFDLTRLTQWGHWTGWYRVDGEVTTVTPGRWWGCRDRSWGVRRVGEPEGGAPTLAAPQFWWLWTPVSFEDVCVHAAVNEESDGRAWLRSGAVVPVLGGPSDPVIDEEAPPDRRIRRTEDLHHDLRWQPGTRWADHAALRIGAGEGSETLTLEPVGRFQMSGIGYRHPSFSHGTWHGELAVHGERVRTDDLDPLDVTNIHVQHLCRARYGGRDGVGVMEQLVVGPYPAGGMHCLLDGSAPSG